MNLNVGVEVNVHENLNRILQSEMNRKKRSILKHVFLILIMSFVCVFALVQKRQLNENAVYQIYTFIVVQTSWLFKTCDTILGKRTVSKLMNYMIPLSTSAISDIASGRKVTFQSLVLPAITAYGINSSGIGPGNSVRRTLNIAKKSTSSFKMFNMLMPLIGQQSLAGQLLPLIHNNITQCLCLLAALSSKELWYASQDVVNIVKLKSIQGNRLRLNNNAQKLIKMN